ncbi:MAG: formate dehydrogenase accessory sulfurtransferase FdhD, partial [Syntrophaceae bacterium]
MDTLLITREAVCQKDGHIELRTEEVCVVRVIRLFLNDEPVGSLVASPSQLKELGAGFVISEGIARKVTDVVTEGDIVRVSAQRIEKPRDMVTGSSGGMSSGALRPGIDSKLTIERDDVFRIIAGIVSELWERTGGAHCSVLYSGNEFITKSSD